jgi:hypothetical protein
VKIRVMKKFEKPPLQIVGSSTPTDATLERKLGEHGRNLWKSITDEYQVEDAGGVETLLQICTALDTAEALAAQIRQDGYMIRTKNGLRDHPLLKSELGWRAFITRNLTRLGINVEAVKSPGRPGRDRGMTWRQLQDED